MQRDTHSIYIQSKKVKNNLGNLFFLKLYLKLFKSLIYKKNTRNVSFLEFLLCN